MIKDFEHLQQNNSETKYFEELKFFVDIQNIKIRFLISETRECAFNKFHCLILS